MRCSVEACEREADVFMCQHHWRCLTPELKNKVSVAYAMRESGADVRPWERCTAEALEHVQGRSLAYGR